jgi:hypothetical protein
MYKIVIKLAQFSCQVNSILIQLVPFWSYKNKKAARSIAQPFTHLAVAAYLAAGAVVDLVVVELLLLEALFVVLFFPVLLAGALAGVFAVVELLFVVVVVVPPCFKVLAETVLKVAPVNTMIAAATIAFKFFILFYCFVCLTLYRPTSCHVVFTSVPP